MMSKRILALLLCAILILAGSACGLLPGGEQASPPPAAPPEPEIPPPPPEFPVVVGSTTVLARPGRVVSLSPALTEKIYDLGLDGRLIGVSDFCDYPAAAVMRNEHCGTALMPDIDAIGRLRAHLVVSHIPLPDDCMAELRRMDIDVVVIPPAQSLGGLWESYIALARMFEGEYAGQEMGEMFTRSVDDWLQALSDAVHAQMIAQEAEPKPALYIRMMPFTVATGDTLENDFLSLIGLSNIAWEQTGWHYEELSREDLDSLEIIFFDEDEEFDRDNFSAETVGINSAVMERQSLRAFEQLLAMARHAWPDAGLPRWPPRITYS
jgi:iron complex transport system substrate-binding protein